MKTIFTLLLTICFFTSCGKDEKPNPKPTDLDPRGTYEPLENESILDKNKSWFTFGPLDNLEGIDIERAYKNLKLLKTAKPVIVAVIDGGFDLKHEDLKGRYWINSLEASGVTGIDDDQNGYIDDINGWNFIGGKDINGNSTHLDGERLESVREYIRLKKLKNLNLMLQNNIIFNKENYLITLADEITGERNLTNLQIDFTMQTLERLKLLFKSIEASIGVTFDNLTFEKIESYKARNAAEQETKEYILVEFNSSNAKSIERLYLRLSQLQYKINTLLNENINPRADIIKDNPDDFSNGIYGNNDVTGPNPLHGTHIAGIIAAIRNNDLGINGVSEYAQIMAIRAVPNGDEYDKDIYFAVKYAVDNGAKIINMSFGKKLSPHKDKLDEIFAYAEKKGVLLVHAAGNRATNTDLTVNYPNRYSNELRSDYENKNWIEVGASTRFNNAFLVANFSNYGARSVDIFAPGEEILSTAPHNAYTMLSGTSMAAPVVSGLLSVLIAQNKNKTPEQLINLLLQAGRKKSFYLYKPSASESTTLNELSRSGSVVDAYTPLSKLLYDK